MAGYRANISVGYREVKNINEPCDNYALLVFLSKNYGMATLFSWVLLLFSVIFKICKFRILPHLKLC